MSTSERSRLPPHAMTTDQVVAAFAGDAVAGLPEAAVAALRVRHGFNELVEEPPASAWLRFAAQFNALVIWVLIAAAVIAGAMGDWTDAAAILAIVLLNGILGFVQEAKAERALAALRRMSAPTARVIRGGVSAVLPARELLPGDRIELEAGDNVPADARLLTAFGLRTSEAALTGESTPVDKSADVEIDPAAGPGDRRNMVHMATAVAAGKGSAIVVATGMETELGRIAGMLRRQEEGPTPLQRRLTQLGRMLVFVCLALVAVVFTLEIARGGAVFEVFLTAVSLAVAAVPEGLPAVVTTTLALGLRRMVRRNALIRRLPAVETLGSVTVICSDKTGTLTRNEMTVREIFAGGETFRVTGTGYGAAGEFFRDGGGKTSPVVPAAQPDLLFALTVGAACNNARLEPAGRGTDARTLVGDPTEGALLAAAVKAGIDPAAARRDVVFELPFDSERKAMSVAVRRPDGDTVLFTKGAPEVIVGKCAAIRRGGRAEPITEADREAIGRASSGMAGRALRVLAVAYREQVPVSPADTRIERELTFAGLAGMIDPPRDEARQAVAVCRQAGIRTIMITGDHPATALAVGRELGIAGPDEPAITGVEIAALSDAELAERLERTAVFARTAPDHKLRIVDALHARGHVVAMTGDGVNDAPAVKAADIGVAMGLTGTDVTKEAADMVLTDDNFASIVGAVEEGRGIFANIRKFVHYLLACNTGELLLMAAAAALGWPPPLLPTQILWINLVTDGLPALALSMEPTEADAMHKPPRPPAEPVITAVEGGAILLHGVLIAAAALIAFAAAYGSDPENTAVARTVAFHVAAFSQLMFVFACRDFGRTLPEIGPFSNPWLLGAVALSALLQWAATAVAGGVFQTVALGWNGWIWVLVAAAAPVTVVEAVKLVRKALSAD